MQTTQTSQFAEQAQSLAESATQALPKPATGVSRWLRRRVRRGLEGQSLVEFAITLPFLIFLVLALVELGFLVRGHLTVTYASRQGVRAGTQAGDYTPVNVGYYGAASLPNGGDDFTPSDMRVPPGSDGDTALVNAVNAALQDKLKDAYLLMSYRADSSDSGKYGLVDKNKQGERWGVVYLPFASSPFHPSYATYSSNPYQRVFQPVTQTLMMTVTMGTCPGPAPGCKQAVLPYIRQGWIPGVMNNDIFTYTVSIPFTVPTTDNSAYKIDIDPDPTGTSQVVGVVEPPGDRYAKVSNYIMVRKSTAPCTGPDPIDLSDRYYGAGSTAGLKAFCGTNDPSKHITPATVGYELAKLSTTPGVLTIWQNSFKADPWYPSWRLPGGVCDITTPSTTPGLPSYYNDTARSPDWLGVRIDYRHYWLTSWFFPGNPYMTLTDKAVKVIEPVPRPSPEWKCK